MSELPTELRENCLTYHRHPGFTQCVYERAAKHIEELEADREFDHPFGELAKIIVESAPAIIKYGYVPGPTHEFVDDGTGLCAHETTDDIGCGLTRHVGCGLLKEQPEHGGLNAQA